MNAPCMRVFKFNLFFFFILSSIKCVCVCVCACEYRAELAAGFSLCICYFVSCAIINSAMHLSTRKKAIETKWQWNCLWPHDQSIFYAVSPNFAVPMLTVNWRRRKWKIKCRPQKKKKLYFNNRWRLDVCQTTVLLKRRHAHTHTLREKRNGMRQWHW